MLKRNLVAVVVSSVLLGAGVAGATESVFPTSSPELAVGVESDHAAGTVRADRTAQSAFPTSEVESNIDS
ncbi:MAG: hypothetical protein HY526_02580 [Betaproteobacteria bacterium]|nr:hypothetical protein [Betaproteobacteria bacterium]